MNAFEKGLLRYLSQDDLQRIQAVKIGIGGAGGLGSNAAMMLVRSGVRTLEIIDRDSVEPSNLNRQQYFLKDLGRPKAAVLRERLLEINPELNILIHQTVWTPENGDAFLRDCPLILEAFDQAGGKRAFVDFYQDKTRAVISGNGMAGLRDKHPLTVKRIGNIYLVGDGQTDTADGHPPMAPRVTACAAMMAEIALDLILADSGGAAPSSPSSPRP